MTTRENQAPFRRLNARATKNALVMPFIAALGYDVFDPTEVVPEFVADVGTKKGEKVDYAIKRGGDVIIWGWGAVPRNRARVARNSSATSPACLP